MRSLLFVLKFSKKARDGEISSLIEKELLDFVRIINDSNQSTLVMIGRCIVCSALRIYPIEVAIRPDLSTLGSSYAFK